MKATYIPTTREEEEALPFPHNENGYSNKGCRGPICREAHALAVASTRAERRDYVATYGLPKHIAHGASAYTNWGCRCRVCQIAHNEECARHRV